MHRMTRPNRLSHAELVQLRKLTTPTVYNGWEQITRHAAAADCFNCDDVTDFTPALGPVVGYAVTAVVQVSDASRKVTNAAAWAQFRRHVAEQPGPKIIVIRDLDSPRCVGTVWGEVASTVFRSLGCAGVIIDGGMRDIDEINAVGFKALSRRLCVGHGHGALLRWGCELEVFGRTIHPGQLIHADKHGFLAIPPEDEPHLLDAARTMDALESGIVQAARDAPGKSIPDHLRELDRAIAEFIEQVQQRFKRRGEW
jgi:4-hydroxy-4-methyl-2-oxoglutarate aldolase